MPQKCSVKSAAQHQPAQSLRREGQRRGVQGYGGAHAQEYPDRVPVAGDCRVGVQRETAEQTDGGDRDEGEADFLLGDALDGVLGAVIQAVPGRDETGGGGADHDEEQRRRLQGGGIRGKKRHDEEDDDRDAQRGKQAAEEQRRRRPPGMKIDRFAIRPAQPETDGGEQQPERQDDDAVIAGDVAAHERPKPGAESEGKPHYEPQPGIGEHPVVASFLVSALAIGILGSCCRY